MSKATEIHGRFTKETMENLLKRLEEKRKDKERMQKEKDKGSGGGSDATETRSNPSQKTSPCKQTAAFAKSLKSREVTPASS